MFTYDEEIFSDLYKDAHGFRPRGHAFYSATPEVKQQIWDSLLVDLHESIEREREIERQAVIDFNLLVEKTIASGAENREVAVRWLMDAEDVRGDEDYFKFLHHLPYNYQLV